MLLIPLVLLQAEKPTAYFRWPSKGVVGKGILCTLFLELPEGLHGYQNPPAGEFDIPVKLSLGKGPFKIYRVDYPKGIDLAVAGADKSTKVYEGRVEIPFILIPTVRGKQTADFKIDYQLCNSSACFPPSTLTMKGVVKVNVAPAPKASH